MSKRTVQKLVTVRINLDAQNGDITTVTEEGLSSPYPFLKHLNEDEIRVLKSMKEGGWYGSKSVAGLGLSEGKARKILSGLVYGRRS